MLCKIGFLKMMKKSVFPSGEIKYFELDFDLA